MVMRRFQSSNSNFNNSVVHVNRSRCSCQKNQSSRSRCSCHRKRNSRPEFDCNRNNNSRPEFEGHKEKRKWSALDPKMPHPLDDTQNADVSEKSVQQSYERIYIRDSVDVDVTTTETQVALNLQVAIQAAIALVVSISIADSSKAEMVTQDLNASLKSIQLNKQETYIENSRNVNVTTTDTDIAVNAQILLQVLLALLIRLEIL